MSMCIRLSSLLQTVSMRQLAFRIVQYLSANLLQSFIAIIGNNITISGSLIDPIRFYDEDITYASYYQWPWAPLHPTISIF